MKYTFNKGEKLKSRKLIELLFVKGKRLNSYPIQLVYLPIEHNSDFLVQTGFSVPKRRIKKAVDRNRIKRIMREAYRLQKHRLPNFKKGDYTKKHVFMFIYMTNNMLPYEDVEKHIMKLIDKFNQSINQY